jgi:hypothetical protein
MSERDSDAPRRNPISELILAAILLGLLILTTI